MKSDERFDEEYLRELEDQLGRNIFELREMAHVIRAQYIKLCIYLIPAVVLAGVIVIYLIWDFRYGDGYRLHVDLIGGTLGVFGLFLLSELISLSLGALQTVNRGNRVRFLQISAIHEAEAELGLTEKQR